MMKRKVVYENFHGILDKEIFVNPTLISILGIMVFSVLTALGAFIYIPLPFTPVPITLQTFFVLLAGLVLKRRDAALSQISYFLLGILGVPVFAAARAGIMSATTGYLVGFVVAAWMVGKLAEKNKSLLWLSFVLIIASILILAFGSIWLSIFLNIGLLKSFSLGALPFIIGDAVKVILAILVYKTLS